MTNAKCSVSFFPLQFLFPFVLKTSGIFPWYMTDQVSDSAFQTLFVPIGHTTPWKTQAEQRAQTNAGWFLVFPPVIFYLILHFCSLLLNIQQYYLALGRRKGCAFRSFDWVTDAKLAMKKNSKFWNLST